LGIPGTDAALAEADIDALEADLHAEMEAVLDAAGPSVAAEIVAETSPTVGREADQPGT
jgi:hypothetical protein